MPVQKKVKSAHCDYRMVLDKVYTIMAHAKGFLAASFYWIAVAQSKIKPTIFNEYLSPIQL